MSSKLQKRNLSSSAIRHRAPPRLVDLYTEDAQVLPPNLPAVKGREALEELFRGFWSEGLTVIDLKTRRGSRGWRDSVLEVGTYTLSGKRKGDAKDQGKYIVIWEKRDGQWKLHRDIFNTSLPVPEDKNQIKRS